MRVSCRGRERFGATIIGIEESEETMSINNDQTVLVLNCGSSSLKFAIINPHTAEQYLSGLAEALTLPEAQISWRFGEDGEKQKAMLSAGADHTAA